METKKFERNPKSERDWKDRKKIEISRNVSKCLEMSRNVSKCLEMSRNVSKYLEISRNVQIKKGVKSPNRKGK